MKRKLKKLFLLLSLFKMSNARNNNFDYYYDGHCLEIVSKDNLDDWLIKTIKEKKSMIQTK